MKFRKAVLKKRSDALDDVVVYTSTEETANSTMCPKPDNSEYHSLNCLQRNCDKCGVKKLKLLPEESSEDGQVTWRRYEYVPTGKFFPNGQEKKKITLVNKVTPPAQLFEYFISLVEDFPYHCFMASWQRKQFNTLLKSLPQDQAIAVHDYSENYNCRRQDEIQSEFFDAAKVSIHVTVLYRHATARQDGNQSTMESPELVKEHIFVLSDDGVQDCDSVHKVQETVCSYLTETLAQPIKHLHEWTDGCAGQYKSRHCVGDLSCSVADFGFPITRNYYETSHAKGEQDAAGGHVKSKVTQAVLKRTARISNAKEMTDFLTEHFSIPARTSFASRSSSVSLNRRLFYCIPESGKGSVERNRPGRRFKEVKGIRKLHSVKSTTRQKSVMVRQRSCYCHECLHETSEQCQNQSMVSEWQEVQLTAEGSRPNLRADDQLADQDTACRVADLAEKGSTVAIAAEDDPFYDYYLLHVTSDGVVDLEDPTTDDNGQTYHRGASVLFGHYYLRHNLIDMTYTLDKKLTICYAGTVRHICGVLEQSRSQRKPIYKLSIFQHEDILASL